MGIEYKEDFTRKWKKYFGGAELPITFRYTDELAESDAQPEYGEDGHCLIGALKTVREGKVVAFSKDSIRCGGGMRYLGYVKDFDAYQKHIEKFLSGTEHYKKSVEVAREYYETSIPNFVAPAKYCVFTPWDNLTEETTPDVVIFFATPDAISGLFNMANYDRTDADGVVCPWGSGCASIAMLPYQEQISDDPRAVLGMFDPSSRPNVGANELCFSVPFKLFTRLIDQMDEMFLTTEAWNKMRERMA